METNVIDEATQPPMLDLMSDMPYMPERETPVDLVASVHFSAGFAADTAAILGPSVGATPIRARAPVIANVTAVDTPLIGSGRDRAETVSPPQGQHMLRATGEHNFPTLTLYWALPQFSQLCFMCDE